MEGAGHEEEQGELLCWSRACRWDEPCEVEQGPLHQHCSQWPSVHPGEPGGGCPA